MNRRRKGGMMIRGIGGAVWCPLCRASAMTDIYPGHPFQHYCPRCDERFNDFGECALPEELHPDPCRRAQCIAQGHRQSQGDK